MGRVLAFLEIQNEQVFENSINYNISDQTAAILLDKRIIKVRKLNRPIQENSGIKSVQIIKCSLFRIPLEEQDNRVEEIFVI